MLRSFVEWVRKGVRLVGASGAGPDLTGWPRLFHPGRQGAGQQRRSVYACSANHLHDRSDAR